MQVALVFRKPPQHPVPMLTQKKDLRGGTPLWADSPGSTVRTRTATRHEHCDVAIIGGGVSGALTALTLSELGLDCVVIDRRKPGSGSTAASTAMIQFELDTPLIELSKKIGARRANRAYRRSLQGVKNLKRLIQKHDIDCDWVDRDALYLAGNEMGFRGLKIEAKKRKAAGLPSDYIDAAALRDTFGIDRTGALLSQGAGELNPALLTAGALRAAQAKGCRVYSDSTVTAVKADGDRVELITETDARFTAKRVIFATGYETVAGVPKGLFDITSSWAIATQPLPDEAFWPTRCLIWEAADPYLYLRATADNRILAGGEDSGLTDPARRDAAIAVKSAKLLKSLNTLLPGRTLRIDYAWAGAFATSPTGLPIITALDELPNCFAILGCGGNGITFSMVAAEIAAAWAQDKRDADSDLFERAGK